VTNLIVTGIQPPQQPTFQLKMLRSEDFVVILYRKVTGKRNVERMSPKISDIDAGSC
jgi:hypothetical protein